MWEAVDWWFWMGFATIAIVIILFMIKTILVFPGLFKFNNKKRSPEDFDMEAAYVLKNRDRKSKINRRHSRVDKSTQCVFSNACTNFFEKAIIKAAEENLAELGPQYPPCLCTQSNKRLEEINPNNCISYLANPNNSYPLDCKNSSISNLPSATSDCGDSGCYELNRDELGGVGEFEVKLQAADDECVIIVRSHRQTGVKCETETRKLSVSQIRKISFQMDDQTCQTQLPKLNHTEKLPCQNQTDELTCELP